VTDELKNADATAKPRRLVGRVTATAEQMRDCSGFATIEKHMIDSMHNQGYRLVQQVQDEYIFEEVEG
jgi:hypothetical protein